jgi:hypothetical protein
MKIVHIWRVFIVLEVIGGLFFENKNKKYIK